MFVVTVMPSNATTESSECADRSDPCLVLWARRAITVPLYTALFVIVVGTLPVTLAAAAIVDAVRRAPWVLARMTVFVAFYLACEVAGIVASAVVWILSGVWSGSARRRERFLD